MRRLLSLFALLLFAGCTPGADHHEVNAEHPAHTPGYTGRDIVPGDSSTIAGDRAGTAAQRTDQNGEQR